MPTDADWGRLYLYNGAGDAGLVMPYRSYYFRDFFPGAWTDLAIGMIYRARGAADDNANLAAERQSETQVANLFHFGLSKSTGGTIPVANNPYFMGVRGVMGGVTQVMTSPLQIAQLLQTLVNGGSTSTAGAAIQMPLSQGVSATPFSMFGIRFTINTLTSRVYLKHHKIASLALANDAANTTTLTAFLNGISNDPNVADASFPIGSTVNFNTFYIYWPYLTNRIQLHAVGALKLG